MNFLDAYIARSEKATPNTATSLRISAQEFTTKYLADFNFNDHLAGLLFGHVQSGKTSQMFAVAAAAADSGFRLFVLVTTDNVVLHRQTLERAKRLLGGFMDGFRVLGETDDAEFHSTSNGKNPTIIVLKKNVRVLKNWLNNLATSTHFKDSPVFVLDDEGDASSLNTKVNDNDKSAIHDHLEKIRQRAPSSFYLHVTATPQSLLLQAALSGWRPSFAHYIAPGAGYLGGDFFYGEKSTALRLTQDNEKAVLLKGDDIPEGLRKAVLSFLIAGSHCLVTQERTVCSLLVHPGVQIKEHDKAKEKVERFLDGIKADLMNDSQVFLHDLQDAWTDLASTKPGLTPMTDVLAFLKNGLPQINVVALNSKTMDDVKYDTGLNVLVGGNSLGRGVTFPGLHTVYYCRSSKTPQADTCWQHARIFGYDRDSGLCRIFTPEPLAKLFRELNDANNALFAVLQQKGPSAVSILTPVGTRPTRMNVVKTDELAILAGGVNYFPSLPETTNVEKLDAILNLEDSDKPSTIDEILTLLGLVEVEKSDPWVSHDFPGCLQALKLKQVDVKNECRVIVRTDRSIKRGTGTLLSPDDRGLGKQYADKIVLTMYRIRGEEEKGWTGKPFWVPNIKFADGTCFYLSSKQNIPAY
ncbi:MAG: Z1 domain-containing protein [bacterium]